MNADAAVVKLTRFSQRYALNYTFDVYNLTNTSTFDARETTLRRTRFSTPSRVRPAAIPVLSSPAATHARQILAVQPPLPAITSSCATGLGVVTHTIGSPRQVQMPLQLAFEQPSATPGSAATCASLPSLTFLLRWLQKDESVDSGASSAFTPCSYSFRLCNQSLQDSSSFSSTTQTQA